MPETLMQKLAACRAEIGAIQATGRNQNQKYTYLSDTDIMRAVRDAMDNHGIVMVPEIVRLDRVGEITAVDAKFHIGAKDCEGGIVMRVPGEGWDKNDKGIYKAMTGARKYALRILFNLATDDDPEQDNHTVPTTAGRISKPSKLTRGSGSGPEQPKTAAPIKGQVIEITGQAVDDSRDPPHVIYSVTMNGQATKIRHPNALDCKAEYTGQAVVDMHQHQSGWWIIDRIEYMED